MIRREQPWTSRNLKLRSVREGGPGVQRLSGAGEPGQGGVERYASEGDDDADAGECLPLGVEVWLARLDLGWRRLVVRRCTSHGRGDVGILEPQSVVDVPRRGQVREARIAHRPHQKVAGAVAREHPSRAIRTVSGRREAQHEQPGAAVPEPRHRASPVRVVRVRGFPGAGNPSAVRAQTRAKVAGCDGALDAGEVKCGLRRWLPRAHRPVRERDRSCGRVDRIRRARTPSRARAASAPQTPRACSTASSEDECASAADTDRS